MPKKIRIVDNTEYVSELSNNGGQYSYTTTYIPIGYMSSKERTSVMYKVHHSTSSEFQYCLHCGIFGHDREIECELPQIVSDIVVTEHINSVDYNKNYKVDYIFFF